MKNWILAIRPKTLFASISPVILGLALAFRFQKEIQFSVAAITLVCAVLLQIASNLANDFIDSSRGVDNDKRIGPIRVTQQGLISSSEMKVALGTILILAFILGLYLMWYGGMPIVFIGLLSLYFAYGYTGGPFPLSYNGLGEVAAFIFFGLFAVNGTFFLQTSSFRWEVILLSCGPGFISATILAINNLRDVNSDFETKKRTVAVVFGENFQRKLCVLLILFSSIVLFFTANLLQLPLLFAISFLPLFFIKTWLHILYAPIDQRLNQKLAQTAQYLLIYCSMTSLILIFYRD